MTALVLLACFMLAAQSQPDPFAQDRAKVAQAEKAHGPESRELADALVGFIHTALFSRITTTEAMQESQRAADVTEIAYGKVSSPHVYALAWQAGLENLNGNFAVSQPIASTALDLARHLSPADPEALQQAANALGNACSQVGDDEDALAAYNEAVASLRAEPKPNWSGLATVLFNRGQVYSHLHRDEQSLADMREAYPLMEKEYGRDSLYYAVTVSYYQATYLMVNGRPEEAVPFFEKTLAAFAELKGPDTIQMSFLRGKLGDALARAGQFDRADSVIQQAVDQERRLLSPGHPELARILATQARAFASGGNLAKALEVALESEQISRQHFLATAAALPERQALSYAESRAHGLDIALSVLSNSQDTPNGAVFEELIRSRALVADGLAWRNQEVALSRDPAVKILAKTLSGRRTKFAQLAMSSSNSDPDFVLKLAGARVEVEEAERQLAGHSASFQREQQDRSVSLEGIEDALPDGGVLISYVRYGQVAVRNVDPKGASTESYAAFLLRKNAPPRFVVLGAARPIDDAVATLRTLIEKEATSPGLAPRAWEQQYLQAGNKLRRAVWDPVADEPGGNATMIFVVPDGMLQFVNIVALPEENGRYVIERTVPIHRLTSERDLLAPGNQPPAAGLLGVGGAVFGPGASSRPAARGSLKLNCEDISKIQFSSLPETVPEVREVSRLFREGVPAAQVVELTGKAASKGGFISRSESQSVLHLATHAFFIPTACAQNRSGARQGAAVSAVIENPLLRAGLVFSGPPNDRILTAEEIASLSLAGTQWAVLSACDSGMGELQDGEGVLGLQRAFRVAGARTVIMSLWPVDDEATSRFMRNLYRQRFREHLSTAESMHQATLQTLQELRAAKRSTHPFYWAGFVASGDWR